MGEDPDGQRRHVGPDEEEAHRHLVEGDDEGEEQRGDEAGAQQRQGHAPEDVERARAEAHRRLLRRQVELAQAGDDRPPRIGHRHDDMGEQQAGEAPGPAEHPGHAEHDDAERRVREDQRQEHQRLEAGGAGEALAREDERAEEGDQRRERGGEGGEHEADDEAHQPVGAGEELGVPAQRQLARREGDVSARREARHHDDDDRGRQEEQHGRDECPPGGGPGHHDAPFRLRDTRRSSIPSGSTTASAVAVRMTAIVAALGKSKTWNISW
jgi:hypothetical protein